MGYIKSCNAFVKVFNNPQYFSKQNYNAAAFVDSSFWKITVGFVYNENVQ